MTWEAVHIAMMFVEERYEIKWQSIYGAYGAYLRWTKSALRVVIYATAMVYGTEPAAAMLNIPIDIIESTLHRTYFILRKDKELKANYMLLRKRLIEHKNMGKTINYES